MLMKLGGIDIIPERANGFEETVTKGLFQQGLSGLQDRARPPAYASLLRLT